MKTRLVCFPSPPLSNHIDVLRRRAINWKPYWGAKSDRSDGVTGLTAHRPVEGTLGELAGHDFWMFEIIPNCT